MTISTNVWFIGRWAFYGGEKLTGISIPNSLTRMEDEIFTGCTSLTNVILGNRIPVIEWSMFRDCTNLTRVTIPDSMIQLAWASFSNCTSLTSASIGKSLYYFEDRIFQSCSSLVAVYFRGNAPPYAIAEDAFTGANWVTLYRLPGTTGWRETFAGRPVVLWDPQMSTSDTNFGVRNNQFGFTITGPSNATVVVETCTDLANPVWIPVGTNALTDGVSHFADPAWMARSTCVCRLRSP